MPTNADLTGHVWNEKYFDLFRTDCNLSGVCAVRKLGALPSELSEANVRANRILTDKDFFVIAE